MRALSREPSQTPPDPFIPLTYQHFSDVTESSIITLHVFDNRKLKQRDRGHLGTAKINIASVIELGEIGDGESMS